MIAVPICSLPGCRGRIEQLYEVDDLNLELPLALPKQLVFEGMEDIEQFKIRA